MIPGLDLPMIEVVSIVAFAAAILVLGLIQAISRSARRADDARAEAAALAEQLDRLIARLEERRPAQNPSGRRVRQSVPKRVNGARVASGQKGMRVMMKQS